METHTVKNGIASPYTGGQVYLVEGDEVQTFRGEDFNVHVRYYECKDTGRRFTSEEQDEQLFDDLYRQYRTRHGIPSPDEMRETRESYGLSCRQMSEMAGFGQDRWAKYEHGLMPSESDGRRIAAMGKHENILQLG